MLNAKVLPPNAERLFKMEKGQTILMTLPQNLIYCIAYEPQHHRWLKIIAKMARFALRESPFYFEEMIIFVECVLLCFWYRLLCNVHVGAAVLAFGLENPALLATNTLLFQVSVSTKGRCSTWRLERNWDDLKRMERTEVNVSLSHMTIIASILFSSNRIKIKREWEFTGGNKWDRDAFPVSIVITQHRS